MIAKIQIYHLLRIRELALDRHHHQALETTTLKMAAKLSILQSHKSAFELGTGWRLEYALNSKGA